MVQVRLTDVRIWKPVGLSKSFLPGDRWQHYEFVFRADRDLKPADSRLSLYFQSTGTLWLADIALAETAAFHEQWLPAIPMTGVKNALPNSSFEAGEGWGTSAGGNFGWMANLFQRLGRWDDSHAFDGKRSWKVTLSVHEPLMLYAAYLQSVTEVRTVELAHAGWVRVEPGQAYTFSVYVKSDRPDTPLIASLKEPESRRSNHRKYSIGRQWQRIQVSYVSRGESLAAA